MKSVKAIQSKIKDLWLFCDFSVIKKTCRKGLMFSSLDVTLDTSPLLPLVVCLCADSLQRVFRGCIKIILGKRRDLEKIFTTFTMLQFTFAKELSSVFFFTGY